MVKWWVSGALTLCLVGTAAAIDVTIDYTYDTRDFFGAGNPDGAAAGARARAAIEAAAGFLSDAIDDTFVAIKTPSDFVSSVADGVVSWRWDMTFADPSTGASRTVRDSFIAPDEYRIYVGGRPLPGGPVGLAGPGAAAPSFDYNGGQFADTELRQIAAIDVSFAAAVESRGEPDAEFTNWGGSVAFDSAPDSRWHWDHTTEPGRDRVDFYTVAVHELFHVLGFGVSEEWDSLVSGGVFNGAAAQEANGGSRPPVAGGHWREGLRSTVYGGQAPQETLLDPTLVRGTRRLATTLDFAALADIGWTVLQPAMAGDFNNDGAIDQADFNRWRDAFGTREDSAANGNGDGLWDAADYTLWRDALVAARGVPEPAAATMLGTRAVLASAAVTRPRR